MKNDPIIINWESCLFLGSSSLLSLDASTLLPDTLQTSLTAGVAEVSVGSLLTLGQAVTLDLGDCLLRSGVVDGEDRADVGGVALGLALGSESSLGGVDLVSRGIELLELAALAGEEDEAGLVVLETVNVGSERLLGVVDTAVVNGDTDGTGELNRDTSFLNKMKKEPHESPFMYHSFPSTSSLKDRIYLQLIPGEPTTSPDTAVVLDGRAVHNRTQLVGRTGSDSSGLCETGVTSAVLATGL